MATAQRTQRTTTPPKPGKPISVRVDAQLAEDLATLMQTGSSASAAIKHAAAIVASIYRNAWQNGVAPEGEALDFITAKVQRRNPGEEPRAIA